MTGIYTLFDSPNSLTCTGWMRTCPERLWCGITETFRERKDFTISVTGWIKCNQATGHTYQTPEGWRDRGGVAENGGFFKKKVGRSVNLVY